MLIKRTTLFRHSVEPCFSVSTDGTQIAFVAGDGNSIALNTADTNNPHVRHRRTAPNAADVFAAVYEPLRWVLNDTAIIFSRLEKGAFTRYLFDLETGVETLIPPRHSDYSFISAVQDCPVSGVKNAYIAVSTTERKTGIRDFEVIDLTTLRQTQFYKNTNNWDVLLFASDMRPSVYSTFEQGGGKAIYRFGDEDPIKWFDPVDVWGSRVAAVSPDGDSIFYISSENRDTSALVELDAETRQEKIVFADDRFDMGLPVFHPSTGSLTYVIINRREQQTILIDPKYADLHELMHNHMGPNFSLRSADENFECCVAEGPEEALYLVKPGEPNPVTQLFNGIRAPSVATKSFWVGNTVGQQILCYASSADKTPGDTPRPLVLLLHGGPWMRDSQKADQSVKWLTNRGYLVLRVNFSGSTGFGKRHLHAARHEWDGRVIDDIACAVQHVLKRGFVKDDLVAVMGHSFGGYAAFMSMVRYPSLFTAGIATSFITDIEKMFDVESWSLFQGSLKFDIGDPSCPADLQKMRQGSPVHNADKITKPLLMMIGDQDDITSTTDCQKIFQDVSENNVDVSYVCFANEYHSIEDPTSFEYYLYRMEAFLSIHLQGRRQDWAPKDLGARISADLRFRQDENPSGKRHDVT